MTNLTNGRVYIGKTVRGYLRRWKEHKDELNRGRHYNVWLQDDWNIFGEKGFSFEILVECDSEDDLNRTEIALLEKFQSYDPSKGYNRTFGGDGGSHTEEVKKQISKTLTGFKRRPMSDTTKEKLRKSALAQWERQRAEGYQYPPLSAESRAKISATLKTKRIPDDVKQKISKALKGKKKPPMQEATKQKIREARAKQAPISDDGRRRISEFHST
jgi:group I intron endonuclease